jgi:hypothetical protein
VTKLDAEQVSIVPLDLAGEITQIANARQDITVPRDRSIIAELEPQHRKRKTMIWKNCVVAVITVHQALPA